MALTVAFIEQLWIGIQGLLLIAGAGAALALVFYAAVAFASAWLMEAAEREENDGRVPVKVPVRRRR